MSLDLERCGICGIPSPRETMIEVGTKGPCCEECYDSSETGRHDDREWHEAQAGEDA